MTPPQTSHFVKMTYCTYNDDGNRCQKTPTEMQHNAMTKEQTVKGEDSSIDVTYCDDDVLYVMTKEMTPKDSHRDATHCDDEGKERSRLSKGRTPL